MKNFLKSLMLFSSLGLPACGASPLWSHETVEAERKKAAAAAAEAASKCAIQFHFVQLCASFDWEVQPTADKMGTFWVVFYQQGVRISQPHDLSVQLWMPSMGHGSSPVTVTDLGHGEYKVSNVFFVMPGDWEIHYQLKDGSNLIDEAVQKIHI